jgi:4-hydroxy 2-oxovalerate aldolase
MSRITVCDATLRDGSHACTHSFTPEQVRAVVAALDDAGIPVIEVSHGDGLGGSSLNYGLAAHDEFELIGTAVASARRADIAVLLLPGIGTRHDLERAYSAGARVARVATHCTEADIAPQHLALARELGMTTVGFLMMAHSVDAPTLADEAAIMAAAGAEVVYVVDSAGALMPTGVRARVEALRARLPQDVEVGFHAHQNLSLAVANTLAAVESGATWVDGCVCGFGAGAGNAPTEVLAAVLDRVTIESGLDMMKLMNAAEDVVRPLIPRPLTIDRAALVMGYAGVYSSFLLHAERAARRFGVDASLILREVGKSKAVGGQEDLIVDVAARLAREAA